MINNQENSESKNAPADPRFRTALHQAAEVFVCGRLHIEVLEVSIQPCGHELGHTTVGCQLMRGDELERLGPEEVKRKALFNLTVAKHAGDVAEHKVFGDVVDNEQDTDVIAEILAHLGLSDQEARKWCFNAFRAALELVPLNMHRIEKLAHALLSKETLSGREALKILRLRLPKNVVIGRRARHRHPHL